MVPRSQSQDDLANSVTLQIRWILLFYTGLMFFFWGQLVGSGHLLHFCTSHPFATDLHGLPR